MLEFDKNGILLSGVLLVRGSSSYFERPKKSTENLENSALTNERNSGHILDNNSRNLRHLLAPAATLPRSQSPLSLPPALHHPHATRRLGAAQI